MNSDRAISDPLYVEYLIIGAHAAIWVVLLGAFALGIPITTIFALSPLLLVIVVPLSNVLGVTLESMVQFILSPVRRLLANRYRSSTPYPEEMIAYKSQ